MLRAFTIFASLALFMLTPGNAAELGEDGLHKEPWFSVTFRDIAEDIKQASAEGKRLVLVFEQRGCIYCKEMHETVLSDPEVRDYIQKNFVVVQYNMFGDEEVTDLDGSKLTEKTAARKWGLIFTPTIVFLPETAPANKTVRDAAVATMPGAFRKGTFLDLFHWVREKGYESGEPFPNYHVRKSQERGANAKE
ncbi:MAG TPA: thioredoxin family protein [Xanthobacteraceae bacterium]|jgi:thioredoxin-related protein|nr:thioredoxin family protein [Xanthobacteraceae bacterium]